MDWIEMIQLRSHSQQDRDEAMAAFRDLSAPKRQEGLTRVSLFRNSGLGNDLCIFIDWSGDVQPVGKSPLGLQLAAAFSVFGQIHHSVWNAETRLGSTFRGDIDEHQAAIQ